VKKDITASFKEKLYECNQHVEKIKTAKNHLAAIMPLSEESYAKLTDVETSFIDQLIFRFSKLQDTLGEKIFPAILILSGENPKKKTFIDILNRLEELEIVNKAQWLSLREMRNEIAHEYSFNRDEVINSIMTIYTISDELMAIYTAVYNFCRNKFDI
jgi:hypothetical protein